MVESYGELVRMAREAHNPPLTAKQIAQKLKVSAPFITDIEKGRRLPSLEKQKTIKKLLVTEQYPEILFDDLAASDNEDTRIVAEDLAKMIRKRSDIRQLLRTINSKKLPTTNIKKLREFVEAMDYAVE